MVTSADKVVKSAPAVQQKAAAGTSFFRKAGEERFFGAKEPPSFFGKPLQPKLTVSTPDDPHEKEADVVAEKVMRMPEPVASVPLPDNGEEKLQRKEEEEIQPKLEAVSMASIQCKEDGEEKGQAKLLTTVKRKPEGYTHSAPENSGETGSDQYVDRKNVSLYQSQVMRQSDRGPPTTSPSFEQTLASSKGGGSALPGHTQRFMESRFGADFSGVRIHTGSTAESLSRSVNAQAFAHGNDIYFNSGKYSPDSTTGKTLLAHELTHTLQQGASSYVKPTIQTHQSENPKAYARSKGLIEQRGESVLDANETKVIPTQQNSPEGSGRSTDLISSSSPVVTTKVPSAPLMQAKCAACEQKENLQKKETEQQKNIQEGIHQKSFFEPFATPPGDKRINRKAAERPLSGRRPRRQKEKKRLQKKIKPERNIINEILAPGHLHRKCGDCEKHQSLEGKENKVESNTEAQIQRYSLGEFIDDVESAESAVENTVTSAGEAVYEAGEAAYNAASEGLQVAADAASEAIDWMESEAADMARGLISYVGGDIRITARGVEISIPGSCPLDAHPFDLPVPAMENNFMVPVLAFPLAPDVFITGALGLVSTIVPEMQLQIGPFCLDDIHILINPLTSDYSISGGISATVAAALGAEITGGVRGEVSLTGVIPLGGVPVPVTVPILGAEGGLAGRVRGIGGETVRLGGSLAYSSGSISSSTNLGLNMKLAADMFAGAYAQLDILGHNICRMYWQPYEWHGDVDLSLGMALSLSIGSGVSATPVLRSPSLPAFPAAQVPLALNRGGFSDDCPLKDYLCRTLRELKLLPSQNGGVWNWGGPFGPGKQLSGPLPVYQKNPGFVSGGECRGACGVNCDTCEHHPVYVYTDPLTHETWQYTNFQDCNSNDGCREHDAAFDWAADKKGETGNWAIIMPWHMAANIECTCNNLAGNCIAWAVGLPPYDRKMYFADSVRKSTPSLPPGGGGGTPLGNDPIGEVGPDFYHYSADIPTGDFRKLGERWTDYHTNCQAEAQAATGVPDALRFVSTLPDASVDKYINRRQFTTRPRMSVIHGIVYPYQHYKNHTIIPRAEFTTTPLTIFTPNCQAAGGGSNVTPGGNEEEDLQKCDRHELPPDYCRRLEDRVIGRFGNRERNLNFDPDRDPVTRRRIDDAPVLESFRRLYNRLDSWDAFIRHRHPDLHPEFDDRFHLDQLRIDWAEELKRQTREYKNSFRDVRNQHTEQLERDFEQQVLREMEGRINVKVHDIAEWYKTRTGNTEGVDELIERVHREGTELWRADWRAAILAVNRILSRLWPPAKSRIEGWVQDLRNQHPDEDLEGSVGDIDYIGSLATGYKGAPKQNIRFNTERFDVDANLPAPPLAKFAMHILGRIPDRGKIFAVRADTRITPLIDFCRQTQAELLGVHGYNPDPADPFDVAIEAPETAGQRRQRQGTDRIYRLRQRLSEDRYNQMVSELRTAGLFKEEGGGLQLRDDLSAAEGRQLNQILRRFES